MAQHCPLLANIDFENVQISPLAKDTPTTLLMLYHLIRKCRLITDVGIIAVAQHCQLLVSISLR